MGALVIAVIAAAVGAGTALHGHLTVDGQFAFVLLALAILSGLIGTLATADAVTDSPVTNRREGGRY